jgi:trehalose 2-sulfotransferase
VPSKYLADLLGAEHDTPFQAPGGPTSSYVVCSTARSGSGLLCRGLASTGVVGAPLEYFNPLHRRALSDRWGCGPDLDSYLEALHLRRSTPTGIFGSKIHWEQLAQVRAEATGTPDDRFTHAMPSGLLDRLLPKPRFVRILRLDIDRQAVSLWRATNSNVWSVAVADTAEAHDPTPYSFDGIDRCRRIIENGELCWDRLIRQRGAEALVITYEELTADFARTIGRVLDHISPGGEEVTVSAPSTRVLGDERSQDLLERFRAERRRRSACS